MTGRPARDERIGAALRELRVPEHRPDFWPRVEAGLRAAPGGRREPAPHQPRRRLRPGRPFRPALGWAGAALAAAAAAAVLLVGLPGGESPQPALATVVKERVAAAVADLRSLEAIVATRGRGSPAQGTITSRARLSLTSAGDLHLDQSGPLEISYDASAGVVRQVTESASVIGAGRFYVVNRGVAPGPPDFPAAPEPIAEARLGAAVRALLASEDPDVRETEHRGRPAWRLVTAVTPNRIYPDVDRLDVIVDQETGLPVRIIATLRGEVVSTVRVMRLRVNTEIPPRRFTVAFPPGADVVRTDEGFERVTLDEAAGIAGYAPPEPSWVPPGYRLAQVAVATRPEETTGRLESNPRSRDVVSLSYRRGFDQLVVTARRSGPDPRAWTDPFAEPGVPAPAERMILAAGRLSGAEARVVTGPRALPHLWAVEGGLVITAGGDASRDELIRVAESL